MVLGGPECPCGLQARAAKGDPAPGFRGKLLGPRESVWLYLSFPVPGQAAEHRLPKLSQTLPVSAPEPPGKDKSDHRREPQQQQRLSFSRGAQGTRSLQGGEALSALAGEGRAEEHYLCLHHSADVGQAPQPCLHPLRLQLQPLQGLCSSRPRFTKCRITSFTLLSSALSEASCSSRSWILLAWTSTESREFLWPTEKQ